MYWNKEYLNKEWFVNDIDVSTISEYHRKVLTLLWNLRENIDCENLAKMCQISTSYYNRIFKKKFSITPKQYVLTKKLNYAIDLLTTTNTPVTAISEMSGFSSLYYFSKIFKKYYNISPQNYRDELVKKLWWENNHVAVLC